MAELQEAPYRDGLRIPDARGWLERYWFSQDHKVIAIQYGITAIAVGVLAVVLSALMRLQLGFPGVSSSSRRRATTSSSPCMGW